MSAALEWEDLEVPGIAHASPLGAECFLGTEDVRARQADVAEQPVVLAGENVAQTGADGWPGR